MNRNIWGILLLVLSVVPFGFLVYTLTCLKTLNITLTHPRVIVEFTIFLVAVIAGIVLILSK